MIEVILFDFGQTLVDSSEGFRTAVRDAQSKALLCRQSTTQEPPA